MHASMPASSCEPAPRSLAAFRQDDRGVSEAVGYSLSFGILAIVLVLSMYAFNQDREETMDRVAELHAESVGQRVASVVVRGALLVEEHHMTGFQRTVETDEQLAGSAYDVSLGADEVVVAIPARGITVAEPLFAAGQSVAVCPSTVGGGHVRVVYGVPPSIACANPSFFLEEA